MSKQKIRPRSDWTNTPFGFARLSSRKLDKPKVRTLAPHYPASGDVSYDKPTLAQSRQRLRNWRNMHVNVNGWADIGYNFAIDQSGNIFTCAGASYAGAHAANNNFVALGVLFIVGDNERPSAKARAAFRFLGKWLREEYGFDNLVAVMDHGRLPGESTACAGQPIRADVNAGNMTIVSDSEATPSSESPSPSGGSSSSGSTSNTSGKSVATLAREVIDGKHGHGARRQRALGNQYQAVQAEVNRILAGNSSRQTTSTSSLSQVARRVINGEYGNEPQRSRRIRDDGYDPARVQREVNRLLGVSSSSPAPAPSSPAPSAPSLGTVAQRVINGDYGNEPARSRRLRRDGHSPAQVQREVNRILRGGASGQSRNSNLDAVARRVLNGDFGNEPARSRNLRAAGYNPSQVQRRVNKLAG